MPPRNPDRVRARGDRLDPRAHKARWLQLRADAHADPAIRAMFHRMLRWAHDPKGEAKRARTVKSSRKPLDDAGRPKKDG